MLQLQPVADALRRGVGRDADIAVHGRDADQLISDVAEILPITLSA